MIRRTELLEKVGSSPNANWLFEAGAGFGKSVLLEQLRGTLSRPLVIVRASATGRDESAFLAELALAARRAGHSQTAEALTNINPPMLIEVLATSAIAVAVDDANYWDDRVVRLLSELAAADALVGRLFIACRLLPTQLGQLRISHRWLTFTTEDLVFSGDETRSLLVHNGIDDRDLGLLLHQMSEGWPLAIATVAAQMERSAEPRALLQQMGRGDSLVDGLLRDYLHDLDSADLSAAAALATLPFFDDDIAELLATKGVLGRLGQAGVPITRRADGWIEIAPHFRGAIDRSATAPGPIDRRVIGRFVDRGEIHAAVQTCLVTGQRVMAAEVLASLNREQEAYLDPAILNSIVVEIGDAARSAPRCLYIHAHVCAMFGLDSDGLVSIERAVDLFDEIDPACKDPAHIEALLMLGMWRAFDGRTGEARRLLERCEQHVHLSPPSRELANLHELRGIINYTSGTDADLEAATSDLTEALEIWRLLREPLAAASTVFRLVSGALVRRGLRAQALDMLDALPAFGPMTMLNTARMRIERAMILPYLGRAAEVSAELREPRRIAKLLGHSWIEERALIAEVIAAGIEGDGDSVTQLCKLIEVNNFLGPATPPEGFRWGEIAEAHARCEQFDEAKAARARTHAIVGMPGWYLDYTDATIESRCGDPAAALQLLDGLHIRDDVEPSMRWNLDLLRAYCCWRLERQPESEKLLDQAFAEAAALGERALPSIVENRLVAAMRTSPAGPEGRDGDRIEISLFGTFAVTVNGQPVEVPSGQASNLLKVLVLGGGRLVVDQIIDPLWPDADLDVGRRRLRNVVRRVREVCGEVVIRTDTGLQLADNLASDYQRALDAATEALVPDASSTQVAQAIDLCDRELLPDDRYQDWVDHARVSLQAQLLRLLDVQSDQALEAGDIDFAVQALVRADTLEPHVDRRRRQASELLRSVGRDAAAASLDATALDSSW